MANQIGFEHHNCRAWGLSFFATPRMVHGVDDGLPAFVNVHMLANKTARIAWAVMAREENFRVPSFGDRASFEGAALGYGSGFRAVEFHGSASFEDAAFDGVSFDSAIFGGSASFAGTAFGDWTFFDFAVFNGPLPSKESP